MNIEETGKPARLLPYLGWLTGALFFFYAWVVRVAPSVMIEELMRDFAVGAAAIGNLSAFYFYGYAGMQVPIGMMMDRFGPRRLMTAAAGVCALGCVLFAVSTAFWAVAAGRFLIGASAAFSLVGAMAVAGLWFPARRFALLSGLAMMMGMAGGVLGQAPLRLVVEQYDWRTAMLMTAAGGLAIAVAAWTTVRDRHRGSGGVKQVFGGLGRVMRNPQTWLIAIAGLGTTGPLLGFAGLWGVPYLEATHGIDRTAAAAVTSTLFIGWGVGAPVFGWLSDRIGRRRPPFIAGIALCTAAMAALVYLPGLPLSAVTALCFLCGFGGSSQIVGFAAAREHNAATLSGTAIGFVNGMVTGAGALYQPLLGWLLDLAWNGHMASGARIYDPAAYRFAFSVLVAGAVIGLLCTLAMRETNCRQTAE
ncbi:MAG: MFS transporter [Hyphomicrobiaceae bacterium]